MGFDSMMNLVDSFSWLETNMWAILFGVALVASFFAGYLLCFIHDYYEVKKFGNLL